MEIHEFELQQIECFRSSGLLFSYLCLLWLSVCVALNGEIIFPLISNGL